MDLMSTVQVLGNIGEFVGAIAVVVTLLYVALQLRQNTASVRSSAYQTWVSVSNAEHTAGQDPSMAPIIAIGLEQPEALSNDTWVQFASYCHQFIMKSESTYYLWKEKIIADSICEKEFDRAARFLSASGPKQWWAAGARTQFSDEFVAMIERRTPGRLQQYWFTPGRGFHPHSDEAND